MTISRLVLIISIVIAVADHTFNNGRLIDALWDQMAEFGRWLSDNLSTLTRKITP
jgi:hypothetical protein